MDEKGLLFPWAWPLSLEELIATQRTLTEVWADRSAALTPIASDMGSEELVVDTRAGEHFGSVRVLDKVDADSAEPLWPSLADAVEDVLAAVTRGEQTKSGWFARVIDGHLDWHS